MEPLWQMIDDKYKKEMEELGKPLKMTGEEYFIYRLKAAIQAVETASAIQRHISANIGLIAGISEV